MASFPGSSDYGAASDPQSTFAITKATPTVTVTDGGGGYNGSAFPASASVAGDSEVPAAALENALPSLAYYTGASASGASSSAAPIGPGTFTVVASFSGSQDYSSGSSQTTFTIHNGSLVAFQETQIQADSAFVFNVIVENANGTLDTAFSGSLLEPGQQSE